jgi:DNA-binding GntR family transcriptional regulator
MLGQQGLLAVEQPASRADRVYDALRRAILEGKLPPGRALVERELSEMLGVSKTPVREALKQLRSTGLVEVNAYSGVSVRRIDEKTVAEVYTARSTVEPAAVRLAVELHGGTGWLGARQALDAAAAMRERGDTASLGIENRRFHRELYGSCGNRLLCEFLDQLQDLTAFVATAGWRLRATFEKEAAEHEAMLEAAIKGDAIRAEQVTRQHIESATCTLREMFRQAGSSPTNPIGQETLPA